MRERQAIGLHERVERLELLSFKVTETVQWRQRLIEPSRGSQQ
jgi:hypothetical protein